MITERLHIEAYIEMGVNVQQVIFWGVIKLGGCCGYDINAMGASDGLRLITGEEMLWR